MVTIRKKPNFIVGRNFASTIAFLDSIRYTLHMLSNVDVERFLDNLMQQAAKPKLWI